MCYVYVVICCIVVWFLCCVLHVLCCDIMWYMSCDVIYVLLCVSCICSDLLSCDVCCNVCVVCVALRGDVNVVHILWCVCCMCCHVCVLWCAVLQCDVLWHVVCCRCWDVMWCVSWCDMFSVCCMCCDVCVLGRCAGRGVPGKRPSSSYRGVVKRWASPPPSLLLPSLFRTFYSVTWVGLTLCPVSGMERK